MNLVIVQICVYIVASSTTENKEASFHVVDDLGPLHTRVNSRDIVMVRILDSHPKAVPCVLKKPFLCSHRDPQA
jgi:hypothetical protein